MSLILIAAGGFCGAVCRLFAAKKLNGINSSGFPTGTFIVNITGSLLLGYLVGAHTGEEVYSFFAIGFTGALTTFSTFVLEILQLEERNRKRTSRTYLTLSLIVGITLAFTGLLLGTL